ncbi:MAG TPA: sigma-70 family RNA polymerase sigma factor [Gemmataceae bacterium]|jgi:RNA polymerase sigma factor (sigma-70 family)
MTRLDDRDLEAFREHLRSRAVWLLRDPRLRGRFDESDLVQETLLRAIDPKTFPCEAKTREAQLAWLISIQNHLAVDHLRKHFAQRRDVRKEVREQQLKTLRRDLDESAAMWMSLFVTQGASPSEQAAVDEEKRLLLQAIAQLPERERLIMQLRLDEDLTIAQIAQRVGLTPGSVAGLIRRAEQRLKVSRPPQRGAP